jgi:rSAM/selenodomain-associated transferase 2
MNAGAAGARSDVLLFLHADTLLPADARPSIQHALADARCVGGRFDVRFEPDTTLGRLIGAMMNWRSHWSGIATGDQALFVRRTAFRHLGGFAEIPIMEDVDFSRRLKGVGCIAALRTPVVTSYRRWNTCGPLRTILVMWALRLLYWLGISPHRLQHLYGTIR